MRYLTETVTQLLDYSRQGAATKLAFPLPLVIDRVVCTNSASQGVSLVVDVPATLPELSGDPDRLQIAISCLVRNALQAAAHKVQLSVKIVSDQLLLSVVDDGPGLPEWEISQLKQPFFTTKASGEGTGLGLSIAENISREHRGSLYLANRDAGGCRVTVCLPVLQEEPSQ